MTMENLSRPTVLRFHSSRFAGQMPDLVPLPSSLAEEEAAQKSDQRAELENSGIIKQTFVVNGEPCNLTTLLWRSGVVINAVPNVYGFDVLVSRAELVSGRILYYISRDNDAESTSEVARESPPPPSQTEQQTEVHTEKHECILCSKVCTSRLEADRHRLLHEIEGEKFFCSICHSGFRRSAHVQEHMLLHVGEKPHTCPDCDASFSLRSDLVRHYRTHSREKSLKHSPEKRFECDNCKKKYSWKGDLAKHMKTHMREEQERASKRYRMEDAGKVIEKTKQGCSVFFETDVLGEMEFKQECEDE